MDRHRLIRFACGLIVISVGQFIVVGAIAIHQYPGGTPFDKTTEGYSFWHNTLSDLGKETAENGQPVGPVAPVFNASMVVMLLGFTPLWLTLPSIFPTRRRLGLIVRLTGLLSLGGIIGVGLTPADQYVWLHALAIICAAVPGIAAIIVACAAMLLESQCSRAYAAFSVLFLVACVGNLVKFMRHFVLDYPWTPIDPAIQKVSTLIGLAWMLLTAAIVWRNAKNDES
jgi:hypothetical membrane protein